jgi:hypothetical protein
VEISGISSTTTDDERARLADVIVDESAGVLHDYTDVGALVFELGANVATVGDWVRCPTRHHSTMVAGSPVAERALCLRRCA